MKAAKSSSGCNSRPSRPRNSVHSSFIAEMRRTSCRHKTTRINVIVWVLQREPALAPLCEDTVMKTAQSDRAMPALAIQPAVNGFAKAIVISDVPRPVDELHGWRDGSGGSCWLAHLPGRACGRGGIHRPARASAAFERFGAILRRAQEELSEQFRAVDQEGQHVETIAYSMSGQMIGCFSDPITAANAVPGPNDRRAA